jgi:hypothetical protein
MNEEFREELISVYDWACNQISHTAQRLEAEGEFPHVTDDGRWRTWPADIYAGWEGESWSHGNWTCGFWVGLPLRRVGRVPTERREHPRHRIHFLPELRSRALDNEL